MITTYDMLTEKRCPECGRVLPIECFGKMWRRRDGKYVAQCYCRECKARDAHDRYLLNLGDAARHYRPCVKKRKWLGDEED